MQELNACRFNGPVLEPFPHTPPAAFLASESVCKNCQFAELCLTDPRHLSRVFPRRVRRVARGGYLYQAGDSFAALYSVRSGFFKTQVVFENGQKQVVGFQMPGELLGMDGVGTEQHCCEAVALEDSLVCVLPYADLLSLADLLPGMHRRLFHIFGHVTMHDRRVMLQLGRMSGQGRLLSFLLDLSERMRSRGYSASRLLLRMTREDIGSHLGLSFETVSRLFSRLQADGLLDVNGREIHILDPAAMLELAALR